MDFSRETYQYSRPFFFVQKYLGADCWVARQSRWIQNADDSTLKEKVNKMNVSNFFQVICNQTLSRRKKTNPELLDEVQFSDSPAAPMNSFSWVLPWLELAEGTRAIPCTTEL